MSELDRYRDRLAAALQTHTPAQHLPVECADTHILVACLRRALRRGDQQYAIASAWRLLDVDAAKFWKPLVAIALKDFGLSDLHLLATIVAAASNKTWRRKVGGDWHVASFLLEKFTQLPCDRRIVKLRRASIPQRGVATGTTSLNRLPPLFRETIEHATGIVHRCERHIEYLSMTSISASACDAALKEIEQRNIVSGKLIEICMQARRTTQSILPVLLPLTLAAKRSMGGSQTIIERGVPEVRIIGGLPSYVFDGNTYLGHMALRQLVKEDRDLLNLLSRIPSIRQKSTILGETLFAVEGGICVHEVSDHFSRELSSLDANTSNSEREQLVAELRIAMRSAIPKLNHIREKLCASNLG
ncbi:MAG: hypothetical protein GC184_10640 [Rhizobiales bacterium]|nr:hypothetical protein [Hyphomicrobiales bacterium]